MIAVLAALVFLCSVVALVVALSIANTPAAPAAPAYAPAAPAAQTAGQPVANAPAVPGAVPKAPAAPVRSGGTYSCRATYYGPDEIHGIQGGNDNIFYHIPSGQYTAAQLRTIGKHFVAMREDYLRKGFMGKVLRLKGSKGSLDAVVVDYLPDRHDGKNVCIDVHDQKDWLALGGDKDVGIQDLTFQVVGQASIPVPSNSAWDPKKWT